MIKVVEIETDRLRIYPLNINVLTGDSLSLLAESIEKEGILEPLIVTPDKPDDDGIQRYTVIDGNHRLAIAESIKLKKLPCIIRPKMNEDERLKACMHINCFKGQIAVDRLSALITRFLNDGMSVEKISNTLRIRPDWVLQYHSWHKMDTSFTKIGKSYDKFDIPITVPITLPRSVAREILRQSYRMDYVGIGSYMNTVFNSLLKLHFHKHGEYFDNDVKSFYEVFFDQVNKEMNTEILKFRKSTGLTDRYAQMGNINEIKEFLIKTEKAIKKELRLKYKNLDEPIRDSRDYVSRMISNVIYRRISLLEMRKKSLIQGLRVMDDPQPIDKKLDEAFQRYD